MLSDAVLRRVDTSLKESSDSKMDPAGVCVR